MNLCSACLCVSYVYPLIVCCWVIVYVMHWSYIRIMVTMLCFGSVWVLPTVIVIFCSVTVGGFVVELSRSEQWSKYRRWRSYRFRVSVSHYMFCRERLPHKFGFLWLCALSIRWIKSIDYLKSIVVAVVDSPQNGNDLHSIDWKWFFWIPFHTSTIIL